MTVAFTQKCLEQGSLYDVNASGKATRLGRPRGWRPMLGHATDYPGISKERHGVVEIGKEPIELGALLPVGPWRTC